MVNDDPSIFDGVGSMGMYSARTGLDVGPHWRDHVHFPSHAPSLPSASRQIRQAFVGPREIQRIELLLDDELPAVVFVDHTGAINTALDPTDTSPATRTLLAGNDASSSGGGGGGGGGGMPAGGQGYGFQEFSVAEVSAATDGFSESRVVGEGGFGTVYRGRLRGLAVAVKRLSAAGLQSEAELHRELKVRRALSSYLLLDANSGEEGVGWELS